LSNAHGDAGDGPFGQRQQRRRYQSALDGILDSKKDGTGGDIENQCDCHSIVTVLKEAGERMVVDSVARTALSLLLPLL
jgi:hypothetical protein